MAGTESADNSKERGYALDVIGVTAGGELKACIDFHVLLPRHHGNSVQVRVNNQAIVSDNLHMVVDPHGWVVFKRGTGEVSKSPNEAEIAVLWAAISSLPGDPAPYYTLCFSVSEDPNAERSEAEQLVQKSAAIAKKGIASGFSLVTKVPGVGNLVKAGGDLLKGNIPQVLKATGTYKVQSRLWVMDSEKRIVISDIDGTITKSDVRGHAATAFGHAVGMTHAHSGICQLLTQCSCKGFQVLYLTARPGALLNSTREYLSHLEQVGVDQTDREKHTSNPAFGEEEEEEDKLAAQLAETKVLDSTSQKLPDGPILCIPGSVVNSFTKEVGGTANGPKEEHLKAVKAAFERAGRGSSAMGPLFFAGLGNKTTDAAAYAAVEVPENHIFIVNTKSEVTVQGTQVTVRSWLNLEVSGEEIVVLPS